MNDKCSKNLVCFRQDKMSSDLSPLSQVFTHNHPPINKQPGCEIIGSGSQPLRHSAQLKKNFKLSVPTRIVEQPPPPLKKTRKSFFSQNFCHKIFAIQCFKLLKIFTFTILTWK